MSDLESEIRSLKLRPPGDGLDDRVLAALRAAPAVLDGNAAAQKSSAPEDTARSGHPSRKGVVVTSGWIVAAAAMVTGIMIGRMMPQVAPHDGRIPGGTVQDSPANLFVGNEPGAQDASGNSFSGRKTTNSADVTPSIGSQIVESIWLSPAAAAVVWEQQTGQIFDVATHVSDRRFDMCRDCHRVGS